MKKGQIRFQGDRPMELVEGVGEASSELTDAQKATVQQIGTTLKAYLNTIEDLLKHKYAHIKKWAPTHLSEPGSILASACPEGVIIRFERKADKTAEKKIFAAWSSDPLQQLAPKLSQNIIHCYAEQNYKSTIPTTGAEIKLRVSDPTGSVQRDIVSIRVGFEPVS